MMTDEAIKWLLEQLPVIVVMGIALYWLVKRYEKAEDEKTELAKNVIKLTVAYEEKLQSDKQSNDEIKTLLLQIREDIKRWER